MSLGTFRPWYILLHYHGLYLSPLQMRIYRYMLPNDCHAWVVDLKEIIEIPVGKIWLQYWLLRVVWEANGVNRYNLSFQCHHVAWTIWISGYSSPKTGVPPSKLQGLDHDPFQLCFRHSLPLVAYAWAGSDPLYVKNPNKSQKRRPETSPTRPPHPPNTHWWYTLLYMLL